MTADTQAQPPPEAPAPSTAAAWEKAFAAERNILWVRNGVIALNVFVYWVLLDRAGTHEGLALVVSIVAVLYAALYTLLRPFRTFPVMLGAPFTSLTEAALISFWLYATGGFASPFYVLWYVSLAAIAFRFSFRTTSLVAGAYAALYIAILVLSGDWPAPTGELLVRIGYIFFVGILGGLLSQETLLQTRAKVEMRDTMVRAKLAQQELQESVSLLNATLESTADGILVVNAEGRITSFNQRFAEMWSLPQSIIRARDDEKALAFVLDQLKEPQAFLAKVKELYAKPDAESFDTLEFKDGRTFERLSRPQRLAGRSIGRVWSFRDVTAQRKAEAENLRNVERAKEIERLKEQDRFKSRFVNSVAHELWTPLTPIKLQLHILRERARRDRNLDEERALEIIQRNMERLQQLVEEMLDGARLQAGRFRVTRVPVNLSPIVREVTDLFEPASETAGIRFDVRVGEPLPVRADRNRLTQVLYNLLSNAFKFTPRGGQVTVIAEAAGSDARVRVQDTGVGMNSEQMSKLFQPFSQAHDPMQQTNAGTGLGLYITKAVIDAHEGTIECRSPGPGKGSTFEFRIPLEAATAPGLDRSGLRPPVSTIRPEP